MAGKTVDARRLTDRTVTEIDLGGGETSRQDCLLGNLEAPAWTVAGWFEGAEEYKYLFWPHEQCACDPGFLITTIHIYLQFDEPVSFSIVVSQEDTNWYSSYCWVSHEPDCISSAYPVDIPTAGLYDIGIPLDGCECSWVYWPTQVPGQPWQPYVITVYFPELFTASLVTDDTPTQCRSFNYYLTGWTDLWYEGFPGDLCMYAEADCCDFPVADEERTWGDLKSLYR